MRPVTVTLLLATGLWPVSASAPETVTPPPYNITLKIAEELNSSFTNEWKGHKTPWRERPIRMPPLPPLDPVGERIRRELQRRRGSLRGASLLPGQVMPMKMLERIDRMQRQFDGKEAGPTRLVNKEAKLTRRVNDKEVGPSRRGHWYMAQLKRGNPYWSEVNDDTIGDKARSMAKETLYGTQERIRLLDEYVDELQHKSGTPALFNIGYTIKKVQGILEDCYIIYTVLYRHKFKQKNWRHNVMTNIYYYTYCFKKYIDIIYYVEAVMVAYADVKKDNYDK